MKPTFGQPDPDRRNRRRREDPHQLVLFTWTGSARPHLQIIEGGLTDRIESDPDPVEAVGRQERAA